MDWLGCCQTERVDINTGRELKCVLEKFAYTNAGIDTLGDTDQYGGIKQ